MRVARSCVAIVRSINAYHPEAQKKSLPQDEAWQPGDDRLTISIDAEVVNRWQDRRQAQVSALLDKKSQPKQRDCHRRCGAARAYPHAATADGVACG